MEKKNKNIEILLRKFIANSYTDSELFELFECVNSENFDEAMSNLLPTDFEGVDKIEVPRQEIKDNYEELCAKIDLKTKRQKLLHFLQYTKYAAMFLLPLTIGLLFGLLLSDDNSLTAEELSFTVEKGNKGELLLSDGTKVWLNGNSKLLYTANNDRTVKLEGEAFFEVAHQKENQFKVKTGHFDITVYGTSFNVSSYESDGIVEVNLLQGSIGISNKEKDLFKLNPGQSVQYNKFDKHFTIIDKDMTDISLWKNKELIIRDFNDEKLFAKLSAWYGVEIKLLNKDPEKRMYNLVITNESLENMLELISKLSPMDYRIEGKEVIVRYK